MTTEANKIMDTSPLSSVSGTDPNQDWGQRMAGMGFQQDAQGQWYNPAPMQWNTITPNADFLRIANAQLPQETPNAYPQGNPYYTSDFVRNYNLNSSQDQGKETLDNYTMGPDGFWTPRLSPIDSSKPQAPSAPLSDSDLSGMQQMNQLHDWAQSINSHPDFSNPDYFNFMNQQAQAVHDNADIRKAAGLGEDPYTPDTTWSDIAAAQAASEQQRKQSIFAQQLGGTPEQIAERNSPEYIAQELGITSDGWSQMTPSDKNNWIRTMLATPGMAGKLEAISPGIKDLVGKLDDATINDNYYLPNVLDNIARAKLAQQGHASSGSSQAAPDLWNNAKLSIGVQGASAELQPLALKAVLNKALGLDGDNTDMARLLGQGALSTWVNDPNYLTNNVSQIKDAFGFDISPYLVKPGVYNSDYSDSMLPGQNIFTNYQARTAARNEAMGALAQYVAQHPESINTGALSKLAQTNAGNAASYINYLSSLKPALQAKTQEIQQGLDSRRLNGF